jgi:hypothetical protein
MGDGQGPRPSAKKAPDYPLTTVLPRRWGRAGRGVQAKCWVAGRSVLHFAVTDAGPGIPAEVCARVFAPCFWMAHYR